MTLEEEKAANVGKKMPFSSSSFPLTTEEKEERKPRIMLVAGEASGDAHGAELIASLRRRQPALQLIGCGGPRMAAEGQDQLFDLTQYAVVGLIEVFRDYFTLRHLFHELLDLARRKQPEVVVFIDYPGFNLRLARRLREILPHSKLIYYISPQVWAWKAHRVKQMARDLDLVLSIFPFEKKWYAKKAPELPIHYVGHPLLDRLQLDALGQREANRIALLPGSRLAEIRRHLPILWESARLLAQKRQGLYFVVMTSNPKCHQEVIDWIESQPAVGFSYQVLSSYALSHLNRCCLALVKSGTGSLECAFTRVPQVVVYRVHFLTYLVARAVIKLEHVSMVNILAEETIVPELLQEEMTPKNIAHIAGELLDDPSKQEFMRAKMAKVIAKLGTPGASDRAARDILMELGSCRTYDSVRSF